MSEDDKQEIVSLLIQRFETQEMPFSVEPAFQSHSRSSSKLTKKGNELVKGRLQGNLWSTPTPSLKELQRQNEQTQDSSSMLLWSTGPVKSDTTEKQTDQRKEGTLATNDNQRFENVNLDGATSVIKAELEREQRKRKIDPTVRSWGEAGPSTRFSSSEDEVDEKEHWAMVKRPKKQKLPSGHVGMSLAMNESPQLRILLSDFRKEKKDKVLSTKQDAATTPVTSGAKVHNKGLKTEAKRKGRFRARKSAGQIKKRVPRQQKRGATSEDPIVLSDDENIAGASEIAERIGPVSNEVIGTGIADDYFSDRSTETDDVALIELLDIYDPPSQSVLSTDSGIQKPTLLNSLRKTDVSSDTDNSDQELLSSVFEYEAKSSSSIGDGLGPKVKTETFESNTDPSSETPVNSSYLKTSTQKRFVPKVKIEKVDSHLATEMFESNTASISERPVLSSAVYTSMLDSCVPEEKVEDATQSDTVLYPEIMDSEPKDYDGNENSGNKEEKVGDDVPDEQIIPESMHGKEDKTLASISKQLEHDAFVENGIVNFWDEYCGYSELVLNSQDNALASIDDDLEELYGTQNLNREDGKAIFSSRDDTEEGDDESLGQLYNNHLNETHPTEQAEATRIKAKKHVTFRDDTKPDDVAASSVRPSVSTASKPAVTIPEKALTQDDFFYKILGWDATDLGRIPELPHKRSAAPVPEKTGFDTMDQYYDTFKPLLFMEIWAKAVKDWNDKDVDKKQVFMDVVDGSAPNNLSIIPCTGIISQEQKNRVAFPLESDLVVVRPIVGDVRDGEHMRSELQYGRDVFGLVEKAEVKPVQSSRIVSTGSSGEDDAAETPKSHLILNIKTTSKFRPPRGSCLQVLYVTSLLTPLRQWVGLMNIPKSLLAKDILKPRKADYFCTNDYQQSSLVSKEYNESQEKVISTAANAVHQQYPIPRICLVQGPPGTGKSYTTVGLVKEILNRPQELPAQRAAGPQTLPNKCRILLCAPSNAAINELIGQIVRARIRLDKRQDNNEDRRSHRQSTVKKAFSKNCGDLCLVRVGRKSQIHPSIARYSLENLVKEAQGSESASSVGGNLATIKDSIKDCDVKEKELDQKIWQLKNSPHPDNPIKLQELHEEKANLKNCKGALQTKYRKEKEKQSNISRQEARIKREILDCADIICTTLSGAGSRNLTHGFQLTEKRSCPFTCVVVDEACQSTELDLLIPLQFKASKLVLVGDPEQLPPTVLSLKAKDRLYKRSMFQRLYRFFRHQEMGKPVLMLEEQYRMHPEIAAFPSHHVYSGRLKTHSSLESRPFPLTKHYAIFDVRHGQEISQERGVLWNPTEVDLIVELCSDLTKVLRPESVGIVTPYKKQKNEIQRSLQKRDLFTTSIEVDTVDAFQGREKDVIILSCVRAKNSRGSIGFVNDKQRMNVALTRARHALYVFGHMETLKAASNDWRSLSKDAQHRKCFHDVRSPEDVRLVLSIGLQNDCRSPAKDPRLKRNIVSASGSDDTSTSSKDRPMHQEKTSANAPPCEQSVRDKVSSTPAVESVPRNQTAQTVATEKDSGYVQIAGETSNRENSVRMKSTDMELHSPLSCDGQVNRKATAYAKTTAHPAHLNERVNRGKDKAHQTNHHRGREAGSSRHSHHEETEGRDNTNGYFHSGRGFNDRHRENRHSSKRPLDTGSSSKRHGDGRETDVSRERHRHHPSKHDRAHEYRHQRRADVPEESAKRRKLQRRGTSHSATITTSTSLGNNTGRREVESPTHRNHSPTTATAASRVSNGEEKDRSSALSMNAWESSPAESEQASSTTTALNSNLDFCGDHMDDGNSDMDTQDPAFAAVLANNHSYAPGYFLHLRQLTKTSTGSSPIETFASTSSPKSPTETTSNNTLHHRHSTSTQPLARSWPSVSLVQYSTSPTGVVNNISTGSSSFTGQSLRPSGSLNTARSNTQQTSLAGNHSSVSHAPHSTSATSVMRSTSTGSSSFSGQTLRLPSSFNRAGSSGQHTSLTGSHSSVSHATHLTSLHNISTSSPSFSGQNVRFSRSLNVAGSSNQQTSLAGSHSPVSHAPHSTPSTNVVRGTSTGSSNFSGQSTRLSGSLNTSRSINQHPSLAGSHSSLGHRSSTILGDIVPDAQEAVDIVRQRHPPAQGPQIIDALFGGRQRRAHAESRDVSSLRERAVGERVERRERRSRIRRGIDKRKYSENYRGRKSWE